MENRGCLNKKTHYSVQILWREQTAALKYLRETGLNRQEMQIINKAK
ncbi:MAG: hypothetical protein KBG54_05340 [Oscillospiraceae bacterium]|nr:hypothetical protein [Oscillospiraceae bacterium]